MQWRSDGTAAALRSAIPWCVLAAMLAATALGWFALENSRESEARAQFERRTDTALAAVRARVFAYEQILRSGAARMASSPSVAPEEWRDFVSYLQLDERFPGVQWMGYAPLVQDWARPTHVQRMRDDGYAEYDIRPAGERPLYVPLVYNEPFGGRNARLVGLDLYVDSARHAAMDYARDSGDVAISGKSSLPGEGMAAPAAQAAFFMFAPLYHDSLRVVSRQDRRPALAGFAFTALRMNDLMRGILDQGVLSVLDMRIFDGPARGTALLIDTRTAWRNAPASASPHFKRSVELPLPGRAWTIEFVSRPEFDAGLEAERPWPILAASLVGSLLVFMLTAALVSTLSRAHQLSMRDPLTGLYNRRYLEETMARELQRARRSGDSIGVIVLDLDYFKQLNDSFGHDAGDYVLGRTGDLLMHATRGSDIACRFGGEEFALILPGATLENTRRRAEAIRASFEALDLQYEDAIVGPLSLSAGVAAWTADSNDWNAVLQRADKALYAAKDAGRNRVVAAPAPAAAPREKVAG